VIQAKNSKYQATDKLDVFRSDWLAGKKGLGKGSEVNLNSEIPIYKAND